MQIPYCVAVAHPLFPCAHSNQRCAKISQPLISQCSLGSDISKCSAMKIEIIFAPLIQTMALWSMYTLDFGTYFLTIGPFMISSLLIVSFLRTVINQCVSLFCAIHYRSFFICFHLVWVLCALNWIVFNSFIVRVSHADLSIHFSWFVNRWH